MNCFDFAIVKIDGLNESYYIYKNKYRYDSIVLSFGFCATLHRLGFIPSFNQKKPEAKPE